MNKPKKIHDRVMVCLGLTAALGYAAAVAPLSHARAQQGGGGAPGDSNPAVFVQGNRGNGAYRDGVTATTRNGNLQATLTTDRSQYGPGRAVKLGLALTNLVNRRYNIAANGVYEYDITVRDDKSNRVVWQWSAGRAARPGAFNLILGANETRANREFWDQRDNAGRQVPPGAYVIEATMYPLSAVRAKIYVSDRGGRPGENGGGVNPGGGVGDLPRPGANGGQTKVDELYADNARTTAALTANVGEAKPGDKITFTFTVTNQGTSARTYQFSSGQQFDMDARTANGARAGGNARQVVWSLSRGMGYTQSFLTIPLAPGQTRTYTGAWTVGSDAPSGAYEIRAYLTPTKNDPSAKATMTLRVTGNGSAPPPSKYNDKNAVGAALPLPAGSGGGNVRPQAPTSLKSPPPLHFSDTMVLGNGATVNLGPPDAVVAELRDITGKIVEWAGRRVLVTGVYTGWKGGPGAPPVRRSDWVIEQNGVSVYVTGHAPKAREGDTIKVTGLVRRTTAGGAYIEAEE